MGAKPKKTRWQSCNVLQVGPDARQLWAYTPGRGGFVPAQQQALAADAPLPENLVAKDWKILFQPKLNVALLPAEKVFLRVLQLPVSSFEEILSMVELQLEKISPLPAAQVVWTVEVLPNPVDNLQTVVVIIVARDVVQQFMGQLEKQGYVADRLEVPALDQLLKTHIDRDGAWIYPGQATGKFTATVAWWYGGVLRNLGLLHIPATPNRSALLEEQLKQMTWAGELEGWLTSPPSWHLVADEATAAVWGPMFEAWLGDRIDTTPALSPSDLATLTANRAARAGTGSGLLPADYSERFRQQFVDRLWTRGLLTVLGIYVFAVLFYFAASAIQEQRAQSVEFDVKRTSATYTNTLQLKAKAAVLKDRQALKYASLDCWRSVAQVLAENLTLQSMDFKSGRTLTINGTAPADQGKLVTDFYDQLRKSMVDNQPLFAKVEAPTMRRDPNGTSMTWTINADLARSVEEAPQ